MTPDEKRWAETLAIVRWKGVGAETYVAERIEALAAASDQPGEQRFRAIAFLLDLLRGGSVQ